MYRIRYAVARTFLAVLPGSILSLAQQAAAPQHPMTFFVTSAGLGKGTDLGGLTRGEGS